MKQLPYIYDTLTVCICHCVIALLCGGRSNNVAQQPKQYRRYPPPCMALVSKRQEPNSGDTQRKNEQHVKIQHLNPSDRYFLVTTYNSIGSLIFMLMIYIPLCLHLCIPEIGLVHISVEYSTQIHRMQEWWKVQNFLTLECESDAFSILVEF